MIETFRNITDHLRTLSKAVLMFTFCLMFGNIQSQDSISVISGDILEDLIENNDEQSYDFLSLYDELKVYLDNPLNLNKVDEDDLRSLEILTEFQIYDIIDHRERYGDFLSPYELQSIVSLDIGTIRALLPFVSTGSDVQSKNLSKLFTDASHSVVLKYKRVIQEKLGYTEFAKTPYLGNADQYYARYNLTSGRNLRMGLTMEKDPGEEFFTGSNSYGFDYYSGFVYLREVHPFFRVVSLGDYSISMGQGLILHNSFGGNKSGNVMNTKRGGKVIRPYSSVNEFNLLRGVATTMHISDKVDLSIFGSSKTIDGNVILNDTIIDTGFERVSSFVTNGLHRTDRELEKEGTVTQQSAGIVARVKITNALKVGFNGLYTKFDTELAPKDVPYRKYTFKGDQLINTSVDYSYRYENFNFFGEVARSDNGGYANIHGALISMNKNLDATVVYRKYNKEYQVLNANAFGETSNPINEQGIYFGILFRPWRSIKVSTYLDFWSHPWLRSKVAAPSEGREFLTKIEYNKKRKFNLYLQYRFEEKEENSSINRTGSKLIVEKSQHRVRLNFKYTYSKELALTSRVEYTHFTKGNTVSQGYLAFQDISFKPVQKPYSFSFRYAIFDTDDSNSRIYTYENDVLYEFSIPFYSNTGTRMYVKAKYRITPSLYIQLRYARTYIENIRDFLLPNGEYFPIFFGSGNELSIGNVRSDLKFVIKYNIK